MDGLRPSSILFVHTILDNSIDIIHNGSWTSSNMVWAMSGKGSTYTPYQYDPFNGHEQASLSDYDVDTDLSDDVADLLDEIHRKEAAHAIRYNVFLLDSFVDTDTLFTMFDWEEDKRGYAFWNECFNELVSAGADEYPAAVRALMK